MAWRRSQKVRCISTAYDNLRLDCTPNMPMFGGCYTIDTIQPIPPEIYNPNESVGLRFIELVNPICPCNRREPMFFWSEHFEPLVEDQQNISALVDAAAKVTLPKREDAKAFFQGGVVTLSPWPVIGEQPSEAMLTPAQVAVMNTTVDKAADDIARAFIRAYVIPLLVKRLGL